MYSHAKRFLVVDHFRCWPGFMSSGLSSVVQRAASMMTNESRAIDVLASGLRIIRPEIDRLQEEHIPTIDVETLRVQHVRHQQQEEEIPNGSTTIQECITMRSPHNSFIFYNHMLVLPGSRGLRFIADTAPLFYNLGLCYHRLGLRHGNPADFDCAWSLYQQCISCIEIMLYELETALRRDDFEFPSLLYLAVLNNLSHLCSHMTEDDSAKYYHYTMRQMLRRGSQTLEWDDFAFFLLASAGDPVNSQAPSA